jgi:site-specific DNA-methyltransferase (adenine-specific)
MLAATRPQADILEVISNLSSNEVSTPPTIANAVLDLLPDEVWSDPDLRWLDPATKTGVFLREAARRLMDGLEEAIPDEEARREHILKNMLHGVAITEFTSLMARRSVYCSKDATSGNSILRMDAPEGNIFFERTEHSFDKKGRCKECGGSRAQLERGSELDNHAYAFIHKDGIDKMSEVIDMQFDVIIGNPPYQLDTQQESRQARPIYNLFLEQAFSLNPRYISMIIPSRWMVGGMGLDSFRSAMLGDKRIRKLVNYLNAAELFPSVGLNGGACYFLWDRENPGSCEVVTHRLGAASGPAVRNLEAHDVFVKEAEAEEILDLVLAKGGGSFAELMSGMKPFGLPSNFQGAGTKGTRASTKVYRRGGVSWVEPGEVLVNVDLIDRWKLLTPKTGSGRERETSGQDMVIFDPIVSEPGSVCTETYIVVGPFKTRAEAESARSYLRTRFARFMLSLRKGSQDATRNVYKWLPKQEWNKTWTDDELFDLYGLSDEQRDFVTERIRSMG